jgi:hypothetical protein
VQNYKKIRIYAKKTPKNLRDPQAKWILFGKKIIIFSRVSLLQSIGYILKILNKLVDETEGKKIPLEEKIKFLEFLGKNENIVSFVGRKKSEGHMGDISAKNETKQENDEESILIPSDHPEKTTSLQALEKKMTQINKLLDDTNLKPEDKKN